MLELHIDEIKKIELQILKYFDGFCKKNNLNYCLAFGTLLGAVRHGGFIPWDDDIDVLMKREDYDRLIDYAKTNRYISENIKMMLPLDDNYARPYIKIVDTETYTEQEAVMKKFQTAIWIDVFPLDYIPENDEDEKKLTRKSLFYRKMLVLSSTNFSSTKFKYYLKMIYNIIASIIGVNHKFWIKKMLILPSYEKSSKIGVYIDGQLPGEKFESKWFEDYCTITFEDYQFVCPVHYDEILQRSYGDYLKIPEEKDRISHKMKAYRI